MTKTNLERKVKLGKAIYSVEVTEVGKLILYEIYRNRKLKVSGQIPKKQKGDLKMILSEHLIISAIYEINHELYD